MFISSPTPNGPPRLLDESATSIARTLDLADNERVRQLAGELGSHLRLVEEMLSVEVGHRGTVLRITGAEPAVSAAARVLEGLIELLDAGHPVRAGDVHTAVRLARADDPVDLASYFQDTVLTGADRRPIAPRSPGQRRYVQAIRRHPVVFGVGPAGTGKTYLAMAAAVAAHLAGDVRRIVLTRPAVEAGEKLGFLPGDLTEKVDPYLRPLFDALHDMLPAERVSRMIERRVIEVAPLAFMRGRTLADAFVVLDEAQNTTVEQMKMFLTRLGERSRMVITGDPTQVDLPRGRRSGLLDALHVLQGVSDIEIVRLAPVDVVRHPLVAAIVEAYAARDADPTRREERDA